MTVGYASILVFAAAAAYARGRNAGAVRWIFVAMLISQIGPTFNWVAAIMGWPLPASGALGITYLTLAIVLPYAVLARGLVAVDFVFSRALVYTIVLTVIVGVFILAEQLVERVALGRVQSAVVDLIVPLALGFSIKWIEASAERLVERVLYRDKMRAADEIDALIDDFPHARNLRALVGRVADDVHRLMRSPFVCIYREAGSTYSPVAQAGRGDALPIDADDPVFLRLRSKHAALRNDDLGGALPGHGAVFPLVVFGGLTGALYAAYRESGEQFDPDELKTLERLAHELAIALLWIERTAQTAAPELDAATS
ncbi:MAG TPA: GAF domain-containing protein [Candidatus Baltobacteraceae bacterium]|nr:GAF domain-containing protein [Candidatus Baltobacteraceae bacterium]